MTYLIAVLLSPIAFPLGLILCKLKPAYLHSTNNHKNRRCPHIINRNVIFPEKEQYPYHLLLPAKDTNSSASHLLNVCLVGAYFMTLGSIGLFWD